jgi:hypothetical protein
VRVWEQRATDLATRRGTIQACDTELLECIALERVAARRGHRQLGRLEGERACVNLFLHPIATRVNLS